MSKNLLRAGLAFLLALVLIGIVGKLTSLSLFGRDGAKGAYASGGGGDTVALLHIEGVITADSSMGGPFGGTDGAGSVDLCDKLYEIRDDDSIKAVILRINSPGGSAAGSDEIYHAVRAISKAGKPVVVSMGDVAASGGYYIASAADYIYANPATLTGSIGVIFELINWDGAADKLGIKSETLHAGEFKDIGSPWREMKANERQLLQGMLTQVHDQFIHAVDEGRKNLDEAAVRKLATGMIYNGEEAAKNGLVDATGSLEDAKLKARELAKLPADAPVEEYGGGSFWDEFFGASAAGQLDSAALAQLAQTWTASQLAARRSPADGISSLARGLYLSTTLRDLVVR